jgi:hypothetical protein
MKKQLTITGAKHWTRKEIEDGLRTDDKWLIRGLLALYERQTTTEQRVEETKEKNFRGFSAADAPKLTGIAKFYLRRKFISSRQKDLVRARIMKYAAQLAQIANAKQAEVNAAFEKRVVKAARFYPN